MGAMDTGGGVGSHVVGIVFVDVAAGERDFASSDINTSTLPAKTAESPYSFVHGGHWIALMH